MYFDNKEQFLLYLNNMERYNLFVEIGVGAQGLCYRNIINNKVYKIFHQFFDEDEEYKVLYKKQEILKFSDIVNDTFIWPKDIIMIKDEVIGYISDYVDAKSLYSINPLKVDLNHFSESVRRVEDDLKIISDNKILAYDMVYNILYGICGIKIIDHDEYVFSSLGSENVYNKNSDSFNLGIMYFLIDGYFDEFILNYKYLKDMYGCNGININEFIITFKKYLSEAVGKEIVRLEDAGSCVNKIKKRNFKYQRILND